MSRMYVCIYVGKHFAGITLLTYWDYREQAQLFVKVYQQNAR